MGTEGPTFNLYEKLRARERAAARPGAHVHRSRAFYESVFPNHTVRTRAPPTAQLLGRGNDSSDALPFVTIMCLLVSTPQFHVQRTQRTYTQILCSPKAPAPYLR